MRITVDYQLCAGNGICEAEAPELFEVQDDGRLRVLDEHPQDSSRERAESAVAFCPTRAIRLTAN